MATNKEIVELVLEPLLSIFDPIYGQCKKAKDTSYQMHINTLKSVKPNFLEMAVNNILKTRTNRYMPKPAEILEEANKCQNEAVKKALSISPENRNFNDWDIILPEKLNSTQLATWNRYTLGAMPNNPKCLIPKPILKRWGY